MILVGVRYLLQWQGTGNNEVTYRATSANLHVKASSNEVARTTAVNAGYVRAMIWGIYMTT